MKKRTLFYVAIATLLYTACSDFDAINSLIRATIDGTALTGVITFSYHKGDQKAIDITSLVMWQVEQKPDWIEVNPLSGIGYQKVTLTTTKENNGDYPYSGEVVFVTLSGETLTIKVVQESESYKSFKADDTPRWESGTMVEKNTESAYTFIIDAGNKLSPANKYKTGRITKSDGSAYEIIEFDLDVTGKPVVGKPTGAQIHKQSGTTPLYSFEIVKIGTGLTPFMWIVFRETATSPERRVVQ